MKKPPPKVSEYIAWRSEFGETAAFLITIADDEGKVHGEVPTALSLMPDLDGREKYYLNAFDRLAGSRNIGMSAGNIPLSEIIRYGEHLDEEDMDAFIIIIQRADNAYLTANRPQAAST